MPTRSSKPVLPVPRGRRNVTRTGVSTRRSAPWMLVTQPGGRLTGHVWSGLWVGVDRRVVVASSGSRKRLGAMVADAEQDNVGGRFLAVRHPGEIGGPVRRGRSLPTCLRYHMVSRKKWFCKLGQATLSRLSARGTAQKLTGDVRRRHHHVIAPSSVEFRGRNGSHRRRAPTSSMAISILV